MANVEEGMLRARAWRARAEELRIIAEQFAHQRARHDLVSLAEAWDKMADREEQRAEGWSELRDAR